MYPLCSTSNTIHCREDGIYVYVCARVLAFSQRKGKDLEQNSRGVVLSYYPGILLEGLRKTTKTLS
jgi:hypothetical protein